MPFPNIDPVLFEFGPFFGLGPFAIRWYGLMYVLGFCASYFLVRWQIKEQNYKDLAKSFEDLNFVLILGVILGGRLGYVLMYNFSYYINNPLEIFVIWGGGMSFHGACFTLIAIGYLFCRRRKLDFWRCADIYTITIPIGLGLGRLANFINQELFGRVTEVPWGVIFPLGGPQPRHPSQLYEAVLEGIVLFTFLWLQRNKPFRKEWPTGSLLACFLMGYGIFRFLVEYVREPDQQLGFLLGFFTMGQLLSLPMIAVGIIILLYRKGSLSRN